MKNIEFEKFLKLSGGGSASARSIGAAPAEICHIVKGRRGVSKEIARQIVTAYPEIDLYRLLYPEYVAA